MQELLNVVNSYPSIWQIVKLLLTAIVTFVLLLLVLSLEKRVAAKVLKRKKNINIRFVESMIRLVLIMLAVEWVVMSSPLTSSFGRVLFQGTAIIGAVAGFAAQPVIADIICGLMMSATKSFDMGDRIELEDGTAGIVVDITLRHVVLVGLDTAQIIIPNSKLNGMKIINMTTQGVRSAIFQFNVSYDTDVTEAKNVIQQVIESSSYTIPGKRGEYGPVYFMECAESSLVMKTTVYFESKYATEIIKNEINTAVKQALDQHGIEIPYTYMNVVLNSQADKMEA